MRKPIKSKNCTTYWVRSLLVCNFVWD
jgi:hypothetical protein